MDYEFGSHQTYDTYEVIASSNVYLGDNSVIEAIGMGSIVVKTII